MRNNPTGSREAHDGDQLPGRLSRLRIPLAYGLAVVLTGGTLWGRLALSGWVGDRPLLIAFLIPIIISSYLGGIGPGMVATVLAALGTDYFLVTPIHSLEFVRPMDFIQWLIFVLAGGLVSCLSGALLAARKSDHAVITELEKAKELLRASNREATELRTALDEHAIVAITNAQGKITFVNDKFCALSKYSREELIGQDHRIINSQTHPKAFFQNLWSTIGRGQVWRGEIQNRAKDGSYYWLDTTIVPFLDDNGKPRQYVAIRADITERKRSELALRASEERFRSLTELSPQAIFLNRDNRIVFVNDAGLKLLRASSPEQVLGRSPLDFFHPDDHAVLRDRIARLLEKPQKVPLIGERMIVIGGAEIQAEVAAVSFEDAGKIVIQVICRDITDRNQAELMSALMTAIVDSSDDAIIGKDLNGIVTSWNRGAERIFGYTAAEMVGASILRIIPPERQNQEVEILGKIRRGEYVLHLETVRMHKDGRPVDISVTVSPIKGAAGRVVGASTIARDIGEQKRANEKLAAERTLLRTLFDVLPDSIYVKDRDSRFLLCNDTCARFMNVASVSDLIGKSDRDFNPPELAARFRATELGILQGKEMINNEYAFIQPDGSRRVLVSSKVPLRDGEGHIIGIVGTGRDVTAAKMAEESLRASEQRFRSTLDNLMEGCQIMGRDWRYLYINATAAGHNHRPADGMIGRTIMECFPGIESTAVFMAMRSCMDGGPAQEMENEFTYPDGAKAWFHLVIQPVPEGVFTLSVDITARKEADEALLRQKAELNRLNAELERRVLERTAQLETANKELEAFSYSVSHDLRAPLRAVDGFSQALLEDHGRELPEEGIHYLNTIRSETQRMGELIDDLLTFSRLSRAPLDHRRIDTAALVRSVLGDITAGYPDRKVELRIAKLKSCNGDVALIKQVWVNLLSNAFKYTGRRDLAVIEIGDRCENGTTVYFVKDNGAGFDMRYVNKLFGVFQRLHRSEDYEGTGVGLAIVQRIIHRHGGRVWAEGVVNQGATFYFTLNQDT